MKNLETPGETGRVGRYRYALIPDCDVCKSKLPVHTVNYRYIQRSLLLCLNILTTVCPQSIQDESKVYYSKTISKSMVYRAFI